ncbi:cupin domain-containing protein [Stakelama pacifica]|uniref:50S ribosomal protein L16 3-hydroxylase n=1 Tax=Stakelama pacifica TaxID=517720 RepID=A0A4R6FZK9_9SPHN|nr:cupin domain-containing protein [Stakelama pacifica]TDN86604.1 50S ribosomal protein L16 3-hydroxylase [Stakelama pacifica]
MQFREFDIEGFLRDYWQRRPLLIRNPWVDWRNPLDPDELAGLACEDGIEARLIEQTSAQPQRAWNVEHGPLPESRFDALEKQRWTLLVQAVDHHVPDVAALITPFRFIPNWRIDDVMVSYAKDGGGVGPHFDHYDVFLIQGAGRRLWQVGPMCDSSTELLPHDDLRLLADFEASEEWILEPGDILYVPPGIAHNGVAIGDECMTYSIGFRAPSSSELIAHYCDEMLDNLQDDYRYSDPDLKVQANQGEITSAAIARLKDMIAEKMLDSAAFASWFGRYSTTPKYPDIDWQPEEPVEIEALQSGIASELPMRRNPASRFSFFRQGAGSVLLFVDGQSFECSAEVAAFAELLCSTDCFTLDRGMAASRPVLELLRTLFDQGSLAFEYEA